MVRGLLVVAGLGCSILGCGADGGSSGGRTDSPPPRGDQKVAGELILRPDSVRAGETIGVVVVNTGETQLFHGLGNRIERRVDGGWVDATGDVYGERAFFPQVGLIVKPGGRAGPDYGQVSDRISLPRALEPGTYRVVKEVSRDGRSARTTLTAVLEVRAPTDDRSR